MLGLVSRFRPQLRAMLKRMSELDTTSSEEEIKRAIGTWRQLQEDLQAYTSDPMSVDDPEAYLAEYVYPSPSWNNFHRVRSLRSQQRPSYLRRKKKRDKTRYKTTLKAQRSTPETRDKLKLRKREERARKRLATERAEEQALASVLGNV